MQKYPDGVENVIDNLLNENSSLFLDTPLSGGASDSNGSHRVWPIHDQKCGARADDVCPIAGCTAIQTLASTSKRFLVSECGQPQNHEKFIPNLKKYKRYALTANGSDTRAIAGVVFVDDASRNIANVCVSEACRNGKNTCYVFISQLVDTIFLDSKVITVSIAADSTNIAAVACYKKAFQNYIELQPPGSFSYSETTLKQYNQSSPTQLLLRRLP